MRRRLVLVAAATTLMVAVAFVVPLALLVRTLAAERALTEARQVAGALAPVIAVGSEEDVRVALSIAGSRAPGPVAVVLPDGRTIGDGTVATDEVARAADGEAFSVEVDGGRDVVTPVFASGRTAVVHVRIPTATLTAGVWSAWLVLGVLGAVLVAAAVFVADRLGRSVVVPADAVAGAARRLAQGELEARAPVAGPIEIADVATALNGLADRIDDLLLAERESAADVSHRLRTPLTALRLDVEALPPGPTTDRLAADVRALEETVDRLIRHARAGRRPGSLADLASVVRGRVAFWTPLLEDEGRALDVQVIAAPVRVQAEEDDVAAVVDALVGNVLHHTPARTPVGVRVDQDGGQASLTVHDAGPGFPDDTVAERGRSGAASTGLGLDIARRLAEDAGGRFALGTGPLGGASVTLTLPVASPR